MQNVCEDLSRLLRLRLDHGLCGVQGSLVAADRGGGLIPRLGFDSGVVSITNVAGEPEAPIGFASFRRGELRLACVLFGCRGPGRARGDLHPITIMARSYVLDMNPLQWSVLGDLLS